MTLAIPLAHYLYYLTTIASSISAGGYNDNARVAVLKPTPVVIELNLPQCFYTSTTPSAHTPLPSPTAASTRPRVFFPELEEQVIATPIFSFSPTTFFGLSLFTPANLETRLSFVLEREINRNQKLEDGLAICALVVVLLAFVVLILQAPSTEADTSDFDLEQEELSNVDSRICFQAAPDAISDQESTSELSSSSSAITYAFETSPATTSEYQVTETIAIAATTSTTSADLELVGECEIASLEHTSLISLAQGSIFIVTPSELEESSDNSLIDFESDSSLNSNASYQSPLSLEITSIEAFVLPALESSIVIVALPLPPASTTTSAAASSPIEPSPPSIEIQTSTPSPSLDSSFSDTLPPTLTTSEATADCSLTSTSTSTASESLSSSDKLTFAASSHSQRRPSPSAKTALANATKKGPKRSRKLQKST